MTTTVLDTASRPRLRTAIEGELAALIAAKTASARVYGRDFERLWILAGDQMLGGKLIRPLLMARTYAALRGEDRGSFESAALPAESDAVIRLAAAIELLHYSFLLHDDVIDGDLTRRGRRNLVGALLDECGADGAPAATDADSERRALHWARSGGILMGDLMLAATHQIFARAPLHSETRIRLLDLLDHTITESTAGEHLDVGFSDRVLTPNLGAILTMSAQKTATYTFELPMRAAAILAGVPSDLERVLTAAGRHLGLAYQLQDDLLSTFGDPAQHGKDPFSDLREGKETAIIAYARMTSSWPGIEPRFGAPDLSVEEGARMRGMLVRCGAERFVQGLRDEHAQALCAVLDGDACAAGTDPSDGARSGGAPGGSALAPAVAQTVPQAVPQAVPPVVAQAVPQAVAPVVPPAVRRVVLDLAAELTGRRS